MPVGFGLFFTLLFAPTVFSDRLFRSDGLLAAFFGPAHLWSDAMFAGRSNLAAIEWQMAYLPLWVFRSLPNGFNLYTVFAYAVAATTMWAYATTITPDAWSPACAGLVFALCGFMVGQRVHVTMIQAAAWTPLIFWAIERFRTTADVRYVGALAVAVALTIAAGHPQMLVYALIVAAFYAVARIQGDLGHRVRALSMLAAGVALGCVVSGIQLIPFVEASRLSTRATLSFEDFDYLAIPLAQWARALYPFLYGGAPSAGGGPPDYFGPLWGGVEFACHLGFVPLILAGIGAADGEDRRVSWFWVAAGAVALLLSMGHATPLGRIAFHVPLMNLFRVPARHLFEFSFAASVLAGLGMASLVRNPRVPWKAMAWALALFVGVAAFVAHDYPGLVSAAAAAGVDLAPFARNRAILVPILVVAVGVIAIGVCGPRLRRTGPRWLLLAVVGADLAVFGWCFVKRTDGLLKRELRAPPQFERIRSELDRTGQRLLALRGWEEPSPFAPAFAAIYDLRSAGGYGPLVGRSFHELSGVISNGRTDRSVTELDDRTLDLLGVRYVVRTEETDAIPLPGFTWPVASLGMTVGGECGGHHPARREARAARPVRANHLSVVSMLTCAPQIEEGTPVGRLLLRGPSHRTASVDLVAGKDVSECAHECAWIQGALRHRLAPTFSHVPGASACFRDFLSEHPIPRGEYDSIAIESLTDIGTLDVRRLRLTDDDGAGHVVVPNEVIFSDARRWRLAETVDGADIYENLRVLPHAWLVSSVEVLPPELVVRAIQTSRLPDGREFDPRTTALLEMPIDWAAGERNTRGEARVESASSGSMTVRTTTPSPSILVLSEVEYPGWKATIDGGSVAILRVDHALRGVAVPAGTHLVRLDYRPRSLPLGAGASALGLFGVAFLLTRKRVATPGGTG